MDEEIKVAFSKIKKLANQNQETNKKISLVIKKWIEKLEKYKHNREDLPKNSKGMFILLDGSITVKNDFNI